MSCAAPFFNPIKSNFMPYKPVTKFFERLNDSLPNQGRKPTTGNASKALEQIQATFSQEAIDFYHKHIQDVKLDVQAAINAAERALRKTDQFSQCKIVEHTVAKHQTDAQNIANKMMKTKKVFYDVSGMGSGYYYNCMAAAEQERRWVGGDQPSELASIISDMVDSGMYDSIVFSLVADPNSIHLVIIPNPDAIHVLKTPNGYQLHNLNGPAFSMGGEEHMFFAYGRPLDQDLVKHILWRRGHKKGKEYDMKKFFSSNDNDYRGTVSAVLGYGYIAQAANLELIEEREFKHAFIDMRKEVLDGEAMRPNPNYAQTHREHIKLWKTRGPVDFLDGKEFRLAEVTCPSKFETTYLLVPDSATDLEDAMLIIQGMKQRGFTKYVQEFAS